MTRLSVTEAVAARAELVKSKRDERMECEARLSPAEAVAARADASDNEK